MDTTARLDASGVAHYFDLILGRPPENEAVVRHYLDMGLSAREFARVLLDSDEVAERYRRRLALAGLRETATNDRWPDRLDDRPARHVLLFGAYGNGNLGDSAQAEAVAFLLRSILPGPPLVLGATSWERRAPYDFPSGRSLASDAMLRADPPPPEGSGPDLIVIGGGGLLGTPHFPLHAPAWVEWLGRQGVKWALLGVGGSPEALAEPAWREAYRGLIAGASYVGVRDRALLDAVRTIHPGAGWFPDPVLARAVLHPDASAPSPSSLPSRPIEALIIPRHPNGAADAAANRAVLAYRDRLVGRGQRVMVVGMERVLDSATLEGTGAVFVDDWAELARLCGQARVVVSLRLHGVIAGLAAGCVVHGLVQPKIGDLMATLGVGEWFDAGGWPAIEPDGSPSEAARFRRALVPALERMRGAWRTAMREAAAALG